MNRKALDRSLPRLSSRKVLVKGNHDTDKLSYYSQYFDDIKAYVVKKGFIMSHIPIHPGSLSRWELNIHGHLHSNKVQYGQIKDNTIDDVRYYCASVARKRVVSGKSVSLRVNLGWRGICNKKMITIINN